MTTAPFHRVVHPATVITYHSERNPRATDRCFARIEWDGKRLSICGVEGPKANGDCWGGCGQCRGDGWLPGGDFTPAQLAEFIATWERWHLNDMRAGCEHQRAEGWDKRPIDPDKPLDSYGRHCGPDGPLTWNMLTWVSPKDHPDGLMTVPCPTCGYRFGTRWLTEEVPDEVLAFLLSLPESTVTPAWV